MSEIFGNFGIFKLHSYSHRRLCGYVQALSRRSNFDNDPENILVTDLTDSVEASQHREVIHNHLRQLSSLEELNIRLRNKAAAPVHNPIKGDHNDGHLFYLQVLHGRTENDYDFLIAIHIRSNHGRFDYKGNKCIYIFYMNLYQILLRLT